MGHRAHDFSEKMHQCMALFPEAPEAFPEVFASTTWRQCRGQMFDSWSVGRVGAGSRKRLERSLKRGSMVLDQKEVPRFHLGQCIEFLLATCVAKGASLLPFATCGGAAPDARFVFETSAARHSGH